MAMYYKQNNKWKKIFVSKEEVSDDVLNSKQDKLTSAQLANIEAVTSKQDKLTAGANIKIENNVISLDIETATAETLYGGDTQ